MKNLASASWLSVFLGVFSAAVIATPTAWAIGKKRPLEPPQVPLPPGLARCSDPEVDLREADPGFQCGTRTGAIYVRVQQDGFGEAWKDSSGVIWSNLAAAPASAEHAIATCASFGAVLPGRSDYDRLFSDEATAVLPNMLGLMTRIAKRNQAVELWIDGHSILHWSRDQVKYIPGEGEKLFRCIVRSAP